MHYRSSRYFFQFILNPLTRLAKFEYKAVREKGECSEKSFSYQITYKTDKSIEKNCKKSFFYYEEHLEHIFSFHNSRNIFSIEMHFPYFFSFLLDIYDVSWNIKEIFMKIFVWLLYGGMESVTWRGLRANFSPSR